MSFTVPWPNMIRVAVANSNRIVFRFLMNWVEFAGKVTIYGKKIDDIGQFNDFSLCRKIVNYL